MTSLVEIIDSGDERGFLWSVTLADHVVFGRCCSRSLACAAIGFALEQAEQLT